LPLVRDERSTIQLQVRDRCSKRGLTADLYLFCKISWKIGQETKDKSDFFPWLYDSVLVVAIELHLGIFEPTVVDFWVIFELELDIDC
jgi:hypothetical protein